MRKGQKHTEETKVKIGESSKGRKFSRESRQSPIGYRRIQNDYVFIKMTQPNVWEREHRVVAPYALGRLLKDEEVVHHIDGNGTNNDPTNLKVFANSGEHIGYHHRGKQISPEQKAKLSVAFSGRIFSMETKAKISAALQGNKHPQWGKSPSLETRMKISKSLKGRYFSPEARKKLSDGHRKQHSFKNSFQT